MPDGHTTRCHICKEWQHESEGCDCTTDLDCPPPCEARVFIKRDDGAIICAHCGEKGVSDE